MEAKKQNSKKQTIITAAIVAILAIAAVFAIFQNSEDKASDTPSPQPNANLAELDDNTTPAANDWVLGVFQLDLSQFDKESSEIDSSVVYYNPEARKFYRISTIHSGDNVYRKREPDIHVGPSVLNGQSATSIFIQENAWPHKGIIRFDSNGNSVFRFDKKDYLVNVSMDYGKTQKAIADKYSHYEAPTTAPNGQETGSNLLEKRQD